MGPEAQGSDSVGMGALAGSAVMLLTFQWFIAIISGRVNLGHDRAGAYGKQREEERGKQHQFRGATYGASLQKTVGTMLATAFFFLIIQSPASQE